MSHIPHGRRFPAACCRVFNKYLWFAIIAVVLLALPYCAGFSVDVFGTSLASFPALLFFVASIILASIRIVRKKGLRYDLIIMGCCVFLIFSLAIPCGDQIHRRFITSTRIPFGTTNDFHRNLGACTSPGKLSMYCHSATRKRDLNLTICEIT